MNVPVIATFEKAYWFIFYKHKLLTLFVHDTITIPFTTDLAAISLKAVKKQYLGRLDNYPCYTVDISTEPNLPENMKFISLRQLFWGIEQKLFWLAGKASQIIHWDHTHQYCGRCGTPTNEKLYEYAKVCPNCGLDAYPRISPSIIVAVLKAGEILLVRSKHFKMPFYTVISGFVEPGETLEECLKREVKEEVGIGVKNITYFGSQPWPFPSSLMIGFIAEYEKGEISIDEEEIEEARWFTADSLPHLPDSISIARQLIDYFIENNKIK
ncbi:MAG: NAD(+) diphosphatase [Desulfotomaculaceae bacterium]|nr:NAD(+) diphosphatase [Desulfotomaculaceae bacterium]